MAHPGVANDEESDRKYKAAVRSMWAMGDYREFARTLVWELGPVVVEAARVRPGERVLDVAAGTGNVALRAAELGAKVVASDLTPEHFAAGRKSAQELGVELEWVAADAEALPFGDAEFDVVTSAVGAIFAPRHQRVADEVVRVLKPGGRVAMANFTPEGLAGAFFDVFAPFMPAPRAGDLPPVLWGSETHVRDLFRERLQLRMTRRTYAERASSPAAYCEFFLRTFGPAVAIRASLQTEPERWAAFERSFLEFAQRNDSGKPGEGAEYRYEYLLVSGTKLG